MSEPLADGRRRACAIALLIVLSGCALPGASAPPRITMDALHQNGGGPPGWRCTPPAGDPIAGRRVFVEFGCHSCHGPSRVALLLVRRL